MDKILGIDLGTNSIGLAVRNTTDGSKKRLEEQLDFYRSVIFKSGVGEKNNSEFSYAAERTKYRSARNRFWARKQRLWATLKVLIENDYCPLTKEGLEKWSRYDKAKGLFRKYPTDEPTFENWIRLDFDNDGKPDYSNPFDIRKELIERDFDFNNQIDRYIFGRAIYHIAQHRGFKSSKGETLKEQEQKENQDFDIDTTQTLKESENKKSKDLTEYMAEHNLQTAGQAYSHLLANDIRVRGSIYCAVRSQFKDELIAIFKRQGFDLNDQFCKAILSEKKGEGTIFYKRPLRSQKGLVGKCTLEKNKARCPISHPDFEIFRALCLINNIKYRKNEKEEWQTLNKEQTLSLLNDRFVGLKRASFKFSDLRKWIENNITHNTSLQYKNTINYPDNTSVSGCPVAARIIDLLGADWKTVKIESEHKRVNRNTGEEYNVTYNYEDIWHICFQLSTSDEPEKLNEIAANNLGFDEENTKKLIALYNAISKEDGYAKLSLKAIRNINSFLTEGFIYSHAVLLAKLPELLKEKWQENASEIADYVGELIAQYNDNKLVADITNNLISKYKQLTISNRFGYKNTNYSLDKSDYADIEKAIFDKIKKPEFESLPAEKQEFIRNGVTNLYQEFFASHKKEYLTKVPLIDFIAGFLAKKLDSDHKKLRKKLYHPSMIEFYPESTKGLLGSPVIGAIRNPMAMRVLHTLRKEVNRLLKNNTIDSNTRIVVETATELNDANWRWAIKKDNENRENKNNEYKERLQEYYTNRIITDNDIKKYRLWEEQGHRCLYTGKIIDISDLLNNVCDIEHTVPRSISFDDSLSNLTVCDKYFNRNIKKNKYPYQLKDMVYDNKNVYDTILENIKPWQDKVARLEKSIESYRDKSRKCQDKDSKDECIQKRHVCELELEYWKKKVNTFTMQEFTDTFRNNQLNDTRTITKYAFHYLKSLFDHVSVQRGSTTAEFRKIIGIQDVYEKKNRNLHSHHAIDAAVLTLIPGQADKKGLLDLFYKKEEAKHYHPDEQHIILNLEKELGEKLEECNIPDASNLVRFIEDNILVGHVVKDQTLTPSHRKMRRRGKIVTDANGNPRWKTGDTVRGQLHEETYYGAIKLAKKDEKGALIRDENGKILTEDKLTFVVKRELVFKTSKNSPGFENWDKLEKAIVDKKLFEKIKNQYKGISFKEACTQGIRLKKKDGTLGNKIRHVRCFTKESAPLSIKKQTYASDKDYKNWYYAVSPKGGIPYMCKYEAVNGNKKPVFIPYRLFDIALQIKQGGIPKNITIRNVEYKLNQRLKKGDIILIYQDSVKELYKLSHAELVKHLYVIKGFEFDGRMSLSKVNLSENPDSKRPGAIDFNNLQPEHRCTMSSLKWLTLGVDFEYDGNEIRFF